MVAFDPVVGVLVSVVHRVGHQLEDDVRQRGGPISDDLSRLTVRVERSCEEPSGRNDLASPRHEDFDDLAVPVYSAIDVSPYAATFT